MAQIDLKNATVSLHDGTRFATTADGVNALAATVLNVNAGDGASIAFGDWLEIGGDLYFVRGVATDAVTISPGLQTATVGGEAISVRNVNGSGSTLNYLEIKIGEGNFTFSEKITREYVRDRGSLDIVRDGDEEPIEVSLDATWEELSGSGANVSMIDFLKNRYNAAAYANADTDACQPFAVDLIVTHEPTCSSGTDVNEAILLKLFRYESMDHDLRNGTLALAGNCNVVEALTCKYDNTAS